MIDAQKIEEELRVKWSDFAEYETARNEERLAGESALERLVSRGWREVAEEVGEEAAPGAIPTVEMERAEGVAIRFGGGFSHHQEAREWADERLRGRVTVAVDGSQIPPSPESGVPVGAVQAAWFGNAHEAEGRYERSVAFEILTPEELLADDGEDRLYSEARINLRRFELEMSSLCERLESLASRGEAARLPVAFIDSPLVISFAERLGGEMRARHIEAMRRVLRCSVRTGIPVVGYIDGSRSRDLLRLLQVAAGLPSARRLDDARLLAPRLGWGDRTPIMICARGGAGGREPSLLDQFGEFRRGIGFVSLRASSGAPPARLEIPLHFHETGQLDEILDVVRAEIIVGNGYPYALQSADAAASIGVSDRERFYAVFQRFAQSRGIDLQTAAKPASKARRR